MMGFGGGGYLDGYMSSTGSSTKKQGGYLGEPNWDSIFGGGGQAGGQPHMVGGGAGLTPIKFYGSNGRSDGDVIAQSLNNKNEVELGKKRAEAQIMNDMAMQQMKAKMQGDFAMQKAMREQGDSQFNQSMALRGVDFENDLAKRRYNTYLGYGI
jgi:hypothetical protein